MARTIQSLAVSALGAALLVGNVTAQEPKNPTKLQPDGYQKPVQSPGGIQVSASASSSASAFGAAQGSGGGAVSGFLNSNASASISTEGHAKNERSGSATPKRVAPDGAERGDVAMASSQSGERRVTTIQRDEQIAVVTQSPKRVSVIIIEDAGDKPRTRVFVAANAEALQKKSALAYALYEEAQTALPQEGADAVNAIGGVGIDAVNNPAAKMLLEQLKRQQNALQQPE